MSEAVSGRTTLSVGGPGSQAGPYDVVVGVDLRERLDGLVDGVRRVAVIHPRAMADGAEALRARDGELDRAAADAPPPPSLAAALRRPDVAVVAEIKRRSPSKGDLAPDMRLAERATAYAEAGAAALSVLTQTSCFGGTAEDLAEADSLADGGADVAPSSAGAGSPEPLPDSAAVASSPSFAAPSMRVTTRPMTSRPFRTARPMIQPRVRAVMCSPLSRRSGRRCACA